MTKLTVHVVLDRSGSMQAVKDDTIGAFNSYVDTLKKESPKAILSLTLFDSQGIDTMIYETAIMDVPKLTANMYQPRASTPLYDAIGTVVGKLTAAKGKRKALVILTDGYENASREWTKDRIKSLLTEKQEKEDWLVIYLGANQDAFAEGAKFGTVQGHTMTFNQQNISASLSAAARSTVAYGVAATADEGRAKARFTSQEREAAK